MTEQVGYTIVASSLGFVSAVFFGIGSAFMRKEKIAQLAATSWGYSPAHAAAIVSQSAQYSVASLFLVAAFFLQIVAAQASTTTVLMVHSALENPWLFAASILALAFFVAWLLSAALAKWQLPRVLAHLKTQSESPSSTSPGCHRDLTYPLSAWGG